MNFQNYQELFTEKALNNGFSKDNIKSCLCYAKNLFDNNVPVIYNTTHLSQLVGYKKNYIKRAVFFNEYFYKEYHIKKKNGKGIRIISEPLPSLKDIQYWILNNILANQPVSKFAKAYIPKSSFIKGLHFHRKQKVVLNVDIKDFFGSITKEQVYNVFFDLGYSKILSDLLSKLCTKDNKLPQGAPTSPYLSNLIFINFDNLISEYCNENESNKIRYTRYADDLSFSGNFDTKHLIEKITEILGDKFSLNKKKTTIRKQGQRQTVNGVIVNEKIQVPIEERKKIRLQIYYIKKFGLESHIRQAKIKHKNYIPYILGKINFILKVNPKDQEFIDYKKYIIETFLKFNKIENE